MSVVVDPAAADADVLVAVLTSTGDMLAAAVEGSPAKTNCTYSARLGVTRTETLPLASVV